NSRHLSNEPLRQRFVEGSVYSLSGFDVTHSDNKFRLSDAPVSIRFTDGTAFDELTNSGKSIPTEMFRFQSYDQLLALANTNRQLPVAQRAPLPDFVGDGAQHGPNDGLQVQNPISSLVPVGNSSTVVETSGGMAAELGESTDTDHQTSSSAAPVEGPSATSTPPVEAEESKNKKPPIGIESAECRTNHRIYFSF
ncbi:unnamed protein product, partial [Brassica rapa subsp. trilocularis]